MKSNIVSNKIFKFFNNYIKEELPRNSTAEQLVDLLDETLITDINISIGYKKSLVSFVVTDRLYELQFNRNKVLDEKTGDIDINYILTLVLDYIIKNKLLKTRRSKETKKEAQQAERQRIKLEKQAEKQRKLEEKLLRKSKKSK